MHALTHDLVELLRRRAGEQAERLAIAFMREGDVRDRITLTYAELHRWACAVADALRCQHGCEAGDRALLAFGPGLDFCAAFWGCLYAGVIAVPVPPPEEPLTRNLPPLETIVRDARPAVALGSAALGPAIEKVQRCSATLRALPWIFVDGPPRPEAQIRCPETPLEASTAAYLQYTSGSTTSSRGVVVSHGNLLSNMAAIAQRFEHGPNDVAVGWLPTFHAMGLLHEVIHPVGLGFPCHLMSPRACLKHPQRWLRAVSQLRATHSGAPNFGFELCVRRIRPEQCESLDLSSWAVAFLAAEPIHHETLEHFARAFAPYGFDRRAFAPGYGLSEACTRVSASPRGHPRSVTLSTRALRRDRVELASTAGAEPVEPVVSCGPPLAGVSLEIVDPETCERSPANAVGEIWIRGPMVSAGYWRQPERTEQTFGGFILPERTGPFLRTGDLGFLHGGQLYVTGRYKDIIIIRGKTYYPQELERAAEQAHPLVRPACCAAFGVTVNREERPVVVAEVERRKADAPVPLLVAVGSQDCQDQERRRLELDPGYEPDGVAAFDAKAVEEAIRRAIAARLGLRLHAAVLIVPGSIPKTSTGKVRRGACRLAYLDDRLQRADRQ